MSLLIWCHICLVLVLAAQNASFTPQHIRTLQNETKSLFNHAWQSYMKFGFPADEVLPLSCEPYGPDFNDPFNIVRNDAMGNISLTVLDNLDTLVIMEEWDEFENALDYLKASKNTLFAKDTIVQVFETTIRSLGGLLSAHLILSDISQFLQRYTRLAEIAEKYDGFLLDMAYDLGKRLIPAFRTKSSIPLPRVHLNHGLKLIPPSLQIDACTSGAGSPVLEFTLLSRLTGDPQFEYFSQVSYWKIWASRLLLGLMPMTIDPQSARWKDAVSGIGASIDSFYEYAVKSSIIFNDSHMWEVFKSSYKSLLTHLVQGGGPLDATMIFTNVGSNDGQLFTDWIDLLSAFWPGLQVLAGQLKDAVKTHLLYLRIWDYFDLIPERWNFRLSDKSTSAVALEWYPLRPEFIESTYYLYRATKDPMYLQIGSRVLKLLQTRYMAKCGLHGVQDIRTGQMQNRMETFVMSETLKYLYLLFDAANELFVHNGMLALKSWVFSTEAHPLWFHEQLDVLGKRTDINATNLHAQDHFKLKEVFEKELALKGGQKRLGAFVKKLNIDFYRKTPNKNQNRTIIHLPAVSTVDPYELKFATCEVIAFDKMIEFPASHYYELENLFELDWKFQGSLSRPPYLSQNPLDGSYIELDPDFFSLFSMSRTNLQSRRAASTQIYDVIVGDVAGIQEKEISIFKFKPSTAVDEAVVLENDLWIPDLTAMRIRVEVLEAGNVDIHNNVLTQEYIDSLADITADVDYQDPSYDVTKPKTALRVTKVNGIYVNSGLIVWTHPIHDNTGALSMTDLGRVMIEGKVVENMMVLWTDQDS